MKPLKPGSGLCRSSLALRAAAHFPAELTCRERENPSRSPPKSMQRSKIRAVEIIRVSELAPPPGALELPRTPRTFYPGGRAA